MGKTILLIHGRSFKPPRNSLRRLWLDAIRHGLERDRSPARLAAFNRTVKEFIYYGDTSNAFLKKALDSGILGDITSFDFQEGSVYDWPVASDFMFRKAAGGGVLADTGAHVLDTLLWRVGDWQSVVYRDDSQGGVEADCLLELQMDSGATGTVQMSRSRALRNTYIIRGDRGHLEIES